MRVQADWLLVEGYVPTDRLTGLTAGVSVVGVGDR